MADVRTDRLSADDAAGDQWLVRPKSIRRLWAGFVVVLAATVLAQIVVPIRGYFGIDGWPGFAAGFGFLSCVVMVLLARALGVLLKRKDDYYDA
jgi:hypothetical protein